MSGRAVEAGAGAGIMGVEAVERVGPRWFWWEGGEPSAV